MPQADKDQEEEVNQRLELVNESDLYFDGERYNEEGEKPMDDDEEGGSDEEYDEGDPSIDTNDELKWVWRVQKSSQSLHFVVFSMSVTVACCKICENHNLKFKKLRNVPDVVFHRTWE